MSDILKQKDAVLHKVDVTHGSTKVLKNVASLAADREWEDRLYRWLEFRKDQQQWVATQKGHDFVSFRPIFTFKIPTSTVLGSRNRFLQSKVRSSEWFKN